MSCDALLCDQEYHELKDYVEDNLCFGCGEKNEHGLKMKFFRKNNHVVGHATVPPYMCGWENIVHGGIISTMLDETMAWTLQFLLNKFMLTKSITINYYKVAHTGEPLKVVSRIHTPPTEREVQMIATLYNPQGEKCAESIGTFAVFSYENAKKLKFVDREMLATFFSSLNEYYRENGCQEMIDK